MNQLIPKNTTMLEKIEQNVFEHFRYLPKLAGLSVRESNILTIINCGLGSSMFNIVCDTHLTNWARALQNKAVFDNPIDPLLSFMATQRYGEEFIETKITEVIDEFKGQPFAWWVGPSCDPCWLTDLLEDMGFKKVTTEHAMALDLEDYRDNIDPPSIQIEQVFNGNQLEDFIHILEPSDSSARPFYKKCPPEMLLKNENLFVGYHNDTPIIIGILYHHEDATGIFSLLSDETQRGHGFGTQMMHHLIRTARENGAKTVTLSASSDSGYRIYERLGFKDYGEFDCLEWKGTK